MSCADTGGVDELGRSQPADRFGVLAISYSEHRVPGGVDPQIMVAGFFARHVAIARDEVLYTLNIPDVPDTNLLDMPLGSCRLMDRPLAASVEPDPEHAFVDLLDAGDIRVHVGARGQRLRRRGVPDIFPHVTGVTYEGIVHDATNPVAGGPIRVEGRGSHEVGDFLVDVTPPPVPRLLEVAGQPVTGGYTSIDDWDTHLPVQWLAAEPAAQPSQRVYIELVALRFDRIVSLRCVTRDDGSAGLPREGVAEVGKAATPDASVHLILRRIARSSFATAGIHTGDVFFVSRDSLMVQ